MGKPVKEYTPGSNLAAMSPERRAEVEAFQKEITQAMVDGLNRAVQSDSERREREERRRREQAGAASQDQASSGEASE